MKRTILLGLITLGSTGALAQQSVKPHPLGATQASSKEVLGSATLARQLPNGSVIVNDGARRRLLLLDPTLQGFAVIADSTSGAANGYGQRQGALIPYGPDSTLYLDVTAGSFLVIDPAGKVARVMSPPRPSDNNFLAVTSFGFPGFDSKGRMVYRSNYPRALQQLRDGSIQAAPAPDSAPILRVNLDTRKADTVGAVKLARMISTSITMPNGGTFMAATAAPMPTIDDWAILSDGTIAILRGQDYHVDWILPDGSKKSTERVPFEWKRLTDDDKLVIIDSITKARAAMMASGGPGGGRGSGPVMAFGDGGGGGGGQRIMIGGGGGGGGGDIQTLSTTTMVMPGGAVPAAGAPAAGAPAAGAPASPASGATANGPAAPAAKTDANAKTNGNAPDPKAANAAAAAAVTGPAPAGDRGGAEKAAAVLGAQGMNMSLGPPMPVVSDLPDYAPPFAVSSARPDADANLWVRTTTSGGAPGNIVYDVINNKGELTDRVDVPRGMTIVGFGRGGIVYLTNRQPDGLHLIRATVR